MAPKPVGPRLRGLEKPPRAPDYVISEPGGGTAVGAPARPPACRPPHTHHCAASPLVRASSARSAPAAPAAESSSQPAAPPAAGQPLSQSGKRDHVPCPPPAPAIGRRAIHLHTGGRRACERRASIGCGASRSLYIRRTWNSMFTASVPQ